ncbi:MAG: hypothetical protein ACRYFR_04520 [Janthinobacterium lividum]
MKESKTLAQIITSRKLSLLPLLDFDTGEKMKENKLVAVLAEGQESTRAQLVRTLYGKGTANTEASFRKLHSRVMAKMLNHLYFLDYSDQRHLVSKRHELECLSLFHKALVLYNESESSLAVRLLNKCLELSQRDGFTRYGIQAAGLLRVLYAQQQQKPQYRAVTKALLELQKVRTFEEEADDIYSDIRLAIAGTVKMRRELLPVMPAYLVKLEELHRKAKSVDTGNYVYQTRLAQQELMGNYAEIIKITAEAARQLKAGKLNPHRFDLRFNHFMSVYAHLLSRQAEKGLKLAAVYDKDFHPSSANWFYFQEHYLLLALHAGDYVQAQQVLQTATGNASFGKQRAAAQQRWELFRAYVDFVQPPARPTPVRRQQMEQWALTIPEYSRDKRGHNVAILVMQVMYFLRQRDLDAVLLRADRLRKYQQRHLREAANLRTRLFLRLLLLIVEQEFDPARSARQAATLLKQLEDAPPPGEAFAEVEIIPYETLWQLALQELRAGPPLPSVLGAAGVG